jgi:hypothetical protein
MKRKIFIICIFSFMLSILISCFSYYTYNDTKVESIVVSNLIYQNSYYKTSNNDNFQYQQYGLMCKCLIKDSITHSEKHYAFINNFSLIQNAYCAYDPGKVEEYKLKDSIQSIQIQSIYDFNDVSIAKSDLFQYFNIGYAGYYSWNYNDSITNVNPIDKIEQINGILSRKDRYFSDIYLVLTLKERPKYEKQQFVVNLLFKSGRNIIDTAKTVNLK